VPPGSASLPTESISIASRNGIYVFDRDLGSGALSLVEVENNTSAVALAVSSDGSHLYASRWDTDSIQAFARNATTGALSFVAAYPALDVGWIRISEDGAHLYAVRASQILTFARNAGTGTLTPVESDSVSGDVRSAALSSDGGHLYVARDGTVGADDVFVYARDASTGSITPQPSLTVPATAVQHLALDPDGETLYVLQAAGLFETLKTYARDASTGALTLVDSENVALDGVTHHIDISSDGAYAYVSTGETDTSHLAIVIFDRDPTTGALTFAEEFATQVETDGILLAPDGGHAYADLAPAIKIYERDAATGSLAFSDALVSLVGAEGGVLSPDGAHAYLRFGRDWITVAERDPVSGDLAPIQTLFERVDGVSGLKSVADLAISDDGAHVYAVSADDDALSAFSRDPSSGELAFVEVERDGVGGVEGLDGPSKVTVSRDGSFVYAGSLVGGALSVFARDPSSGELEFVEAHPEISGITGIAACPGSGHVYVNGQTPGFDAGTHAYARNALTGALQLEASYDASEGDFGYPGFGHLGEVACSAGGEHVYTSGTGSFPTLAPVAIAVYSRDAATGELDILQLVRNGSGGVFDITGGVSLSADGQYLYSNGLLSVFRRDVASGEIALADVAGAPGSEGWVNLSSPDGRVYRLGGELPGIEVYERGFACAPTPASSCRTSDAAKIDVVDSLLDLRDKVSFGWTKGQATSADDFDPGTSNHFALCLYDESGPPALVFAALAPANEDCRGSEEASSKPCWTAGTVTKLKDPFATPDGLRDLQLKSGVHEKVAIKASALGKNVRGPDLPVGLPLRAQIQSAEGLCWEAVFPSATRNDPARFKAKTSS